MTTITNSEVTVLAIDGCGWGDPDQLITGNVDSNYFKGAVVVYDEDLDEWGSSYSGDMRGFIKEDNSDEIYVAKDLFVGRNVMSVNEPEDYINNTNGMPKFRYIDVSAIPDQTFLPNNSVYMSSDPEDENFKKVARVPPNDNWVNIGSVYKFDSINDVVTIRYTNRFMAETFTDGFKSTSFPLQIPSGEKWFRNNFVWRYFVTEGDELVAKYTSEDRGTVPYAEIIATNSSDTEGFTFVNNYSADSTPFKLIKNSHDLRNFVDSPIDMLRVYPIGYTEYSWAQIYTGYQPPIGGVQDSEIYYDNLSLRVITYQYEDNRDSIDQNHLNKRPGMKHINQYFSADDIKGSINISSAGVIVSWTNEISLDNTYGNIIRAEIAEVNNQKGIGVQSVYKVNEKNDTPQGIKPTHKTIETYPSNENSYNKALQLSGRFNQRTCGSGYDFWYSYEDIRNAISDPDWFRKILVFSGGVKIAEIENLIDSVLVSPTQLWKLFSYDMYSIYNSYFGGQKKPGDYLVIWDSDNPEPEGNPNVAGGGYLDNWWIINWDLLNNSWTNSTKDTLYGNLPDGDFTGKHISWIEDDEEIDWTDVTFTDTITDNGSDVQIKIEIEGDALPSFNVSDPHVSWTVCTSDDIVTEGSNYDSGVFYQKRFEEIWRPGIEYNWQVNYNGFLGLTQDIIKLDKSFKVNCFVYIFYKWSTWHGREDTIEPYIYRTSFTIPAK